MNSSILSPRNVTLFVFILVVLFLGATFDVQVGPESFVEGNTSNKQQQGVNSTSVKEVATSTKLPTK